MRCKVTNDISEIRQSKGKSINKFEKKNHTSCFAEGTFARENKEKQVFLWFSARLFVTLASPKVLSLGKTKKNSFSFGFPLAYSYLCTQICAKVNLRVYIII